MTAPLQIVCTGTGIPADAQAQLSASGFGPFVLLHCDTWDDLAAADADAHWLACHDHASLASLAAWPALSACALHVALVVVAPAPDPVLTLRLLQAGVQEVVPAGFEGGQQFGQRMALALVQAIERKRLEAGVRLAYATDLSTGLPNHAQLLEHMQHLLALREREPAPMALIVLRVQGLAHTEAALGVEAAHVLRRKVAVRLRSGLRASDVVASIGADAFAVLLAWTHSPQDGERVAAKLAQSLARPFSVAGRQQSLGVSAGLASYPEHGKDADGLVRRALSQAAQMATVGGSAPAQAADRGPTAAANDA